MTIPTDEIEDLRVDASIGGSFDSYLGGGPKKAVARTTVGGFTGRAAGEVAEWPNAPPC
ncbi:MAG: hypothetical protein VYA51_02790 [Planctomycetota bacterium]|nr:hypothetical protein [Planctomycetota bacterium]MEC8653064.1 hypothetical protein [Planctomycetota bacterium]MEC9046913.1 hypothetical protein [Planctomycetota bacterium]